MEEQAEQPSEKITPRLAVRHGTVRSAALGNGSATRRGISRSQKHNDANYVLSEKFGIN